MSSNWPGSRPSQSPAEILPPESRANPGSYPEGRMAGYDGDPGPLRPSPSQEATVGPPLQPRTPWSASTARCIMAMVLRGVSPSNPTVQDLVNWGANFGGLCACRAVVASAHGCVCARRHPAPGDQHVVFMESGVAGRAAARARPGWLRFTCSRESPETCSVPLSIRRLSAPAPRERSLDWPGSLFCCLRRNCFPCLRRRFAGCARA